MKHGAVALVVVYVAVLAALMWAAKTFDSPLFGGLGFTVLGLGGVWFGVDVMRRREDVTTGAGDEGYSDFISTRRGFAAVLSGLGLALLGLIAVAFGIAFAGGMVKSTFGFVKEHGWTFAGLGGVWLAALGLFKMLGDEESKGKFDRNWIIRWMDRVIGVPILLVGLAVASAGLIGYVPLIGWVR